MNQDSYQAVPSITDPCEAYEYARTQRKRIPELEHIIMKSPVWAYYYAIRVIKGRWIEAEPYIFNDYYRANEYLREIPEARTPSKDVPLVIGNYAITDIPNTITDEQVNRVLTLLEPQCNFNAINFLRCYFEPKINQLLKYKKLIQTTIEQIRKDEKIKKKFISETFGSCNQSDFE